MVVVLDRFGAILHLADPADLRPATSPPGAVVTLSRRAAAFLLGVGAWTWLIWPAFLRNIWRDERSWDSGPTRFFLVHLVLTVTSLALGSGVGVLGWRGLRPRPAERTLAGRLARR